MQIDRTVSRSRSPGPRTALPCRGQHRPRPHRRAHSANHVVRRDGRCDLARLEIMLRRICPRLTPSILVETPSWLSSGRNVRRRRGAAIGRVAARCHQRAGSSVSAAFFAEIRDLASRRRPPGSRCCHRALNGCEGWQRHPPARNAAFSSVHWSVCWFSRAKSPPADLGLGDLVGDPGTPRRPVVNLDSPGSRLRSLVK